MRASCRGGRKNSFKSAVLGLLPFIPHQLCNIDLKQVSRVPGVVVGKMADAALSTRTQALRLYRGILRVRFVALVGADSIPFLHYRLE